MTVKNFPAISRWQGSFCGSRSSGFENSDSIYSLDEEEASVSRGAAKDYSPRRKPWVRERTRQRQEGERKILRRTRLTGRRKNPATLFDPALRCMRLHKLEPIAKSISGPHHRKKIGGTIGQFEIQLNNFSHGKFKNQHRRHPRFADVRSTSDDQATVLE
jgi:hypothetical protein